MDLSLGAASDYRVWDNVESISYQSATKALSAPLDAVAVAKRRALTKRELAASGGAYTSLDLVWLLPAALLTPGLAPKPGDAVVDADQVNWTVLETSLGKWRQTWRLTCRNPIIAFDLRDAITIEQAAVSYDAAGALLRAWPSGAPAGGQVLYSGLACRVQPMTAEVKEERGIRGQETAYEIHLSRQVQIDVRECRVVWQGLTLDLVEYKDGNRIDVLPCLTTQLRP